MWTGMRRSRTAVVVLTMFYASLTGVAADEETGWTDVAELSLVATDGNSESTSFGFKNTLERKWDGASFTFKVSGIRVEAFDGDRFAVGSQSDNRTVDPPTEVTAERYDASARFGQTFTERTLWYAGLNWERDEEAGVDDRTVIEAGMGNVWVDKERVKLSTRYAATYTDEALDTEDNDYAGYRLSYDYENKLTETATFDSDLTLDGNFDESTDWRADFSAGLAVAMNANLALKVGARLRYDHRPSFETVQLFDNENKDNLLGETDIELDELDTTLTASLVINFK